MKKPLSVLIFFVFTAAKASTLIGPEALLPNSLADVWGGIVNIRPATNAAVTINPPQFSWFLVPGDGSNYLTDTQQYSYVLQIAYDNTFSSPVVNVSTPFNYFNFLPLLNTNISPIYWRVAYLGTNGLTNSWQTNSFGWGNSITNFDRSLFTDNNYWFNKMVHPHLMWTQTNFNTIYNFIRTDSRFSNGWITFSNQCVQVTTNTWWTNTTPWAGTSSSLEGQALSVGQVAMMYGLTTNTYWTNGLVNSLTNMFTAWTNTGAWKIDYGNAGGDINWLIGVCFAYDNAYSLLNASQISSCLTDFHYVIRNTLYNYSWTTPVASTNSFTPNGSYDTNGIFAPPFRSSPYILGKTSSSHAHFVMMANYMISLTCAGDSFPTNNWPIWIPGYTNDARAMCELYLNYVIGRLSPHGRQVMSGGRSYASDEIWDFGALQWNLILMETTFPEVMINPHPDYAVVAETFCREQPPLYGQTAEAWGDYVAIFNYHFRDDSKGGWMSLLTQSGDVRNIWEAAKNSYGWNGYSAVPYTMVPYYYFAMPAQTTNQTFAKVYPAEGWVMAAGTNYNVPAAFTNSVGFVFASRSDGLTWNHDYPNDNDVEVWAYGAELTHGAESGTSTSSAAKPTWMHNNILINGAGQYQPGSGPIIATPAKIFAFTNGAGFAYAAGDSTYSYPHSPVNNLDLFFEIGSVYSLYAQTNGPLFTKNQRQVLFPRYKYLVLFDDLAASTNVTFSWVWHTLNWNVSDLSGGSFSYRAPVVTANGNITWPYPWSDVKVVVQQVVDPALLTSTNMAGTNAYLNPFTGENGYFTALNEKTNLGVSLVTNSIYVSNLTPTNNFHFMTLVYPVRPGDADPIAIPLDAYTLAVSNADGTIDTNTFNPNYLGPYTTKVALTTIPRRFLLFRK